MLQKSKSERFTCFHVGFYLYIAAKVFPNTSESVDIVISPRDFYF